MPKRVHLNSSDTKEMFRENKQTISFFNPAFLYIKDIALKNGFYQ
jgi:hypothetical protein